MNEQTALDLGLITTADIVKALYEHYSGTNWLCFNELRVGTGFGKDAEQRIDFWALDTYPSHRFRRVAYEIKVSRSDFLNELRQPLKRRRALLLSNEFYFISPPGLIKAGELPIECGLAEITGGRIDPTTTYINFKHAAPWRDTIPPTWQFVAAVVRRAKRESL